MPAASAKESPGEALRAFALSYAETSEHFPWGETAIKVRNKTFLFMRSDEGGLSTSTKLPHSREEALRLLYTEPTHYGLGNSGWVTATFDATTDPPLAQLREWIDESYRAVAPKKLVAALPPPGTTLGTEE